MARRDLLLAEISGQMSAMRTSARQAGFRHLLGRSISLTHLHVLALVRSHGPIPVSELARALDVSVASATGIVSRMEERGLVARTRGAEDRRVVTVELAGAGVAALDEIDGRGQEYFTALLRTLTVGELEQLRGGLAALQRAREGMAPESADRPQAAGSPAAPSRATPRPRAPRPRASRVRANAKG